MNIPLAKPDIRESDIEAVVAVLRSSRLSLGPVLHAFENALAKYIGVSHAVAVNSGTSALQLALRALHIGDGDEVILPSFSFMAVTNAVLAARAIPVYADIDPQTLNLDAGKVGALVSPRTKAIIAVHTFGFPAQMNEILAVARHRNLFVIEDACEAVGAEVNGRKVGAQGDAGIFAFYPNKQITAGEGGALVTNSPALAQEVRSLSNQGRGPSTGWFQHEEAGYSYRLSDINCALGLQQIARMEEILSRREELARRYQFHLSRNPHMKCFFDCPYGRKSYFTFPVLLPSDIPENGRDEIWHGLRKLGIESGRYFPPAHLQPVMQRLPYRCGDLSHTIALSRRLLCLPFFHSMQENEIESVCASLTQLLEDQVRAKSVQAVS
jgi:perosamine synthetase